MSPMTLRWLRLFLLLFPIVPVGALAGQAADTSAPDAQVLGFRDFFKLPIGPRGLEPSDRLLSLREKRVRVQGYMVKEEEPMGGFFLLTPTPVSLAELADGPADYLPAATLFVHLAPGYRTKIVGHRAGTWEVTGTLKLGAWQEPNGRVSYVRLVLDDMASVKAPDERAPDLFESVAVHRH